MGAIKAILAHSDRMQLRIMRDVLMMQSVKVDIVDTVLKIDDLYESIIQHRPDLVIMLDYFFSPCINIITANTETIIITEYRIYEDSGNVHFAYVPVQPQQLAEMVQEIFEGKNDFDLIQSEERKKTFFSEMKFPQKYCSSIDSYCKQNNLMLKNVSIFAQRRDALKAIRDGKLSLNRMKIHHPNRSVNLENTYKSAALRIVDDLGEIVDKRQMDIQDKSKQFIVSRPTASIDMTSNATAIMTIENGQKKIDNAKTEDTEIVSMPKIIQSNQNKQKISESETLGEQKEPKKETSRHRRRRNKHPLINLEWKERPKKRVYYKGEPLDFSDSVILGYHTDGSITEYQYNSQMIFSMPNMNTPGKKIVGLKIRGLRLNEQIEIKESTLERLILIEPGKVNYLVGERFSAKDYKIVAEYSDGSKSIVSNFKYKKNPLKVGQSAMMLEYGSETLIIPIKVFEKKICRVKLETEPAKKNYLQGEQIDVAGGTILVFYNDGSQEVVPISYDMIKTSSTQKIGEKEVFLDFGGFMFSYKIHIQFREHEKQKGELSRMNGTEKLEFMIPPKTVYQEGDIISKSMLAVKKVSTSGSFSVIRDFDFEPKTPLTSEDKKIMIRKDDMTLEIDIEVMASNVSDTDIGQSKPQHGKEVHPELTINKGETAVQSSLEPRGGQHLTVMDREVSTVALASIPNKTEYLQMEGCLDLTGGKLLVVYTDGKTDVVEMTPEMLVSQVDWDTMGVQYISVCYKPGKDVVFPIVIKQASLVKVVVVSPPSKTSYVDGETLDISGLVLEGEYNNGQRIPITDFSMDARTLHIGEAVVQCKYNGLIFPIFVSVSESKISGIHMHKLPDKLEYVEKQGTFDATGGIVAIEKSSGQEEYIPLKPEMVAGFSNSATGICSVTVLYDVYKTSFDIKIIAKSVQSMELICQPKQIRYFDGDVFNPEGALAKVTFDNGTTEQISDFEISPKTIDINTQEVMLSYRNFSVPVKVYVQMRQIEAIIVISMPNKVNYKEGENFDATGGKIMVMYNNNTNETVDMTQDMVMDYNPYEVGTQVVTVQYETAKTTMAIQVEQKLLIAIAVSSPPIKTDYRSGEAFDTSGMVIMGYYDNGTSEEIRNYMCIPDVVQAETAVIIRALDKIAVQAISINNEPEPQFEPEHVETQPVEEAVITTSIATKEPMVSNIPDAKECNYEPIPKIQMEPVEDQFTINPSHFYSSTADLRFQEDEEREKMFF